MAASVKHQRAHNDRPQQRQPRQQQQGYSLSANNSRQNVSTLTALHIAIETRWIVAL